MEDRKAIGVRLVDDSELGSTVVLSNATPKVTFLQLLSKADVSKAHLTCPYLYCIPGGTVHKVIRSNSTLNSKYLCTYFVTFIYRNCPVF